MMLLRILCLIILSCITTSLKASTNIEPLSEDDAKKWITSMYGLLNQEDLKELENVPNFFKLYEKLKDVKQYHAKTTAGGSCAKLMLCPQKMVISALTIEWFDSECSQLTIQIGNIKVKLINGHIFKDLSSTLPHFFTIDFTAQALLTLPSSIGLITNLINLNLQNNKIKKLPPEIGNLQNLKSLDVSGNQLIELPAEIGKLVKLEKLLLARNNIKNIPSQIGEMTRLRELILSNNKIDFLPREIGELKSLDLLNLTGNSLSDIPVEMKSLTLRFLYLDKNNFKILNLENINTSPMVELFFYNKLMPKDEKERIENFLKNNEIRFETPRNFKYVGI